MRKGHRPRLSSQVVTSNLLRHPVLITSLVVILLLVVGAGGYMLIEKWSFVDALYMTVITMSTIGYGEVAPLSLVGRIYTIGLIVVGVIIASYALTTVMNLFTSKEFVKQIRMHRRHRQLEKISNHCIICGFGRMGRSLADELQARGSDVIAIDTDNEVVERCHQLGIPAIQGNAADERVLHEAGIERAKSLVAGTRSDAENVFIILTAKSIKPDLQIIARCNAETSIPKITKAGADTVISPYAIAGRRVAHMLIHPSVTQFLDGILDFGDHQMRLEEFIIDQTSPLAGLTLREAKLKVAVLAVNHPDQQVFAHPHADTKLLPCAAIIVMGIDQELNRLAQLVKG